MSSERVTFVKDRSSATGAIMADAEIDSIFPKTKSGAPDALISELKKAAIALSITSSIESRSVDESAAPTYARKTFRFDEAFPRLAYCDLTEVSVFLIQTAEGAGSAYLTLTQECQSRRSDVISGWDWHFHIDLRTQNDAFIRSVFLGTWNHVCGKKLVELKEDFTWVVGSINPVENAAKATLHWQAKQRVHNCG